MAVISPRASAFATPPAPIDWPEPAFGESDERERGRNTREWLRKVAELANNLLDGKTNARGTFTLTVNSLTTTVKDRRCGPQSVIYEMATTESAGGEMGIYYTSRGAKSGGVLSFVVNHGKDSRTDRTFDYVIFG